MEVSISLLKDGKGKDNGSVGIIRDITKRKHAEEELRKQNAQLERSLEESTADLQKEIEKLKRAERAVQKKEVWYLI